MKEYDIRTIVDLILNGTFGRTHFVDNLAKVGEGYYSLKSSSKYYAYPQEKPQTISELLKEMKSRIEEAISDETTIGIYSQNGNASHSMPHIEDVILFTSLLSNNEFSNDQRMQNLCIESAKYHDCGRSDYTKHEHAEESAQISYEILSKTGKYSDTELAVIYTAIIIHDAHVDANGLNNHIKKVFDKVYTNIVNGKNPEAPLTEDLAQVNDEIYRDVIKVCTIIRDADALDRTRFREDARSYLDQERLSPNGKKYVEFAIMVSEYRSIEKVQAELKKAGLDETALYDIIKQEMRKGPVINLRNIVTGIRESTGQHHSNERRHHLHHQ